MRSPAKLRSARVVAGVLVLLVTAGVAVCQASNWNGKNYGVGTFPFKFGLLMHNDDYVKFTVDETNKGFYYVTFYGAPGIVEIYVEGKSKGIKTLENPASGPLDLPTNEGGACWAYHDLSAYMGKSVSVKLRDHNGRGDTDICIKLGDNTQAEWRHVDSRDGTTTCCKNCAERGCRGNSHKFWCDLDACLS